MLRWLWKSLWINETNAIQKSESLIGEYVLYKERKGILQSLESRTSKSSGKSGPYSITWSFERKYNFRRLESSQKM